MNQYGVIMRDKFVFVPGRNLTPQNEARRDGIVQLFQDSKASRKILTNQRNTRFLHDLNVWQANPGGVSAHPILWDYEKDHLNGGANWGRFKAALLLRYRGVIEIDERLPAGRADVYSTGIPRELIGTVYFSWARFIPLNPQPLGLVNQVYVRRTGAARHYVLLPNSATYARRFVTRGLNASDGMNYTNAQPLEAPHYDPAHPDRVIVGERQVDRANRHNVGGMVGVNLTENQQIMSHARGWKKRYISTGHSNRPAISTRGQAFVSMYGTAVIDLAMLNLNTVFDLHRPDTAQRYLGRPATDVTTAPGHGSPGVTYADEQFLGLRDVLRTRELLIKGSVPIAALCATNTGAKLVGISSTTNGLHNAVPGIINGLSLAIQGSIQQTDSLTFRINGLKWHFYAFASFFAAVQFMLAVNPSLHANQAMVRFNKYQLIQPPGMI